MTDQLDTRWTGIERIMRERAYRTIERDPQILLETNGGPVGLDADLIYARLIGFEDEVVQDGLRLSEAVATLRVPIPRRPLFVREDADSVLWETEPTRVALYELQSGFATLSVSGEYLPPVEQLRPDNTARVAYLRYRRRS